MNPQAYLSYSHEVSSWLHAGRSQLVQKVLSWSLTESVGNREMLEVGAGVGQNIPMLSQFGQVDALELDPLGLAKLRDLQQVRHVFESAIPSDLQGMWDVICACDVIEHIEDDRSAIQWIFDHLKPGGIFLATVPAFQWLYSDHDRALGHYRRYNAENFERLLPADAVRLYGSYFNSYLFPLGLASRMTWQMWRRFRGRNEDVPKKQPVPTGRYADKILRTVFLQEVANMSETTRRGFGLSYYVCARKLN
ncbi:methyltransferase domain-containing protein [Acidovorax sp. SDU_ACID1]|uniref:class I SAM-dependent methyltransferase n=1 Tax=Acidovorax sp. SDU_ACID1 TaxID=3136632 RepID=UPI003872CACA